MDTYDRFEEEREWGTKEADALEHSLQANLQVLEGYLDTGWCFVWRMTIWKV